MNNYYDHTEEERKLIRQFGGKPLKKYGYDGTIGGKWFKDRSYPHKFLKIDDAFI